MSSCQFPKPRTDLTLNHPFADARYMARVVANLKNARNEQGISLRELIRNSGLKKGLIRQAEEEGCIPACRDSKAWAQALGLPWEQLCNTKK